MMVISNGLIGLKGCVFLVSLEYRDKLVLLSSINSLYYLKLLALYLQLSVLYLKLLALYDLQL